MPPAAHWFSSTASTNSLTETEILAANFWKKVNSGTPRPLVAKSTPDTNDASAEVSGDQSMLDDATPKPQSPLPLRMRPMKKTNLRQFNSPTARDYSVPVSKFLQGFRVQAAASLSNAYRTHHPLHRSANTGIITTSLAEDIFFLIEVQLNVLNDFLEDAKLCDAEDGENVIEDALLAIFRSMWAEQTRHREVFLTDFELCCATANDFFRMMNRMEDLMAMLEHEYPFLEWNALDGDTKPEVIRREANDLATLFVSDAVLAAQTSHTYVMAALKESTVADELFSRDWEDRYTHNEVILNMIRAFEEFNNDLQNFLCNDYLYHKVVVALVQASVCFYVNLLLQKSSYIRKQANKKFANKFTSEEQRRKALPFACPARALCRMMYDIRILQDYFLKISRDSQALTRVVANEMNSLTVIHEFLGLAVGHTSMDSLEEFIVVLHKRSGANADITRHFLSDLWVLAAPNEEKGRISITIAMMKSELDMVSERMKENDPKPVPDKKKEKERKDVTPRLEQLLKDYYEDRIWQEKISGCGGMLKARRDH